MKLCTFSQDDTPLRPGVVVNGHVVDISDLREELPPAKQPHEQYYGPGNWMSPYLTPEGLARIGEVARAGDDQRPTVPLDDVRLGPPVPRPGKIVAAGRNYRAHMEEAMVIWRERGRAVVLPTVPTGFLKVPSAVVGPFDDVVHPAATNEMDYEAELAVVIGSYARDVPVDEALSYVAGYTMMNDLNARDIQFAEMDQVGIVLGKNFEGFAPMGPFLVTTDELPDPQAIRLRCWVNGDLRQDASTSGMVFSVAELVAHFSQMGLYAGDVVMTGAPEGIAASRRPDPQPYYLKPGTTVETEAEGIGRLVNNIVEAR